MDSLFPIVGLYRLVDTPVWSKQSTTSLKESNFVTLSYYIGDHFCNQDYVVLVGVSLESWLIHVRRFIQVYFTRLDSASDVVCSVLQFISLNIPMTFTIRRQTFFMDGTFRLKPASKVCFDSEPSGIHGKLEKKHVHIGPVVKAE